MSTEDEHHDRPLPQLLQQDTSVHLAQMEVLEIWETCTALQKAWIEAYIQNGMNATQAVYDAGYNPGSDRNARVQGYQNRHNARISRLLEVLFDSYMPEHEALQRVSQIAAADMSDFISYNEDGSPYVDLEKAKGRGVMHLVKEVKIDEIHDTIDGETRKVGEQVSVKLYDKQKALDKLLKVHGSYKEDEHAGESQTINIFNQINGDLEQSVSSLPSAE